MSLDTYGSGLTMRRGSDASMKPTSKAYSGIPFCLPLVVIRIGNSGVSFGACVAPSAFVTIVPTGVYALYFYQLDNGAPGLLWYCTYHSLSLEQQQRSNTAILNFKVESRRIHRKNIEGEASTWRVGVEENTYDRQRAPPNSIPTHVSKKLN